MKRKIDEVDIAILKILQADADKSQKEIAAITCRSSTNIGERIKWLKTQNYILCTRAILNPKKLNIEILAHMVLTLTDSSASTLANFDVEIHKIKEVCKCDYMTGDYNIKLTILTTDSTAYYEIESLIKGIEVVKNTKSQIILDEIITYSGFDF